MSSPSLSGKVALITGAGRGIGAATARLLAENGAHLVLTSRTKAELDSVAQSIVHRFPHTRTVSFLGDLGNEPTALALWKEAIQTFGTVDILVNNAAMIEVRPFTDTDPALWDQVMALNLKAPYLLCREMLLHYQATQKQGGAIINISSLGGLQGTQKFPGFGTYTISKFGMVGLTEVLAVEALAYGIRVNCVAPGAIDTAMLKKAAPFLKTKTKPEDIAQAILYFGDPMRSGAITGSTLPVHSNA